MADQAQPVHSLGHTKPQPFGVVLRAAIVAEFGTNREFSLATGKSEGRISQIVKGPEPPDTETLRWILETFRSSRHREDIQAAWVRDFASVPYPFSDDHDAVITYVNELADAHPRRALRFAESKLDEVSDPVSAHVLLERMVHLNLKLAGPGKAATALNEMERRARIRNEPGDLLTALWMRGNVLRNLEGISIRTLLQGHESAGQFAAAWTPRGQDRARWTSIRSQMERDFALHILRAQERKPQEPQILDAALEAVKRSIELGESQSHYFMGLEVRARIELALGHVCLAEDTLDEIEEDGYRFGTENLEKTVLTRAKIMLVRGERDQALTLLQEISDYCFERMNLHHQRQADQLVLATVGRADGGP